MTDLMEHAQRELKLAGLFDEDSDYSGQIAKEVIELLEVWSKYRHSGGSAWMTIDIFNRLIHSQALTDITSDPAEWEDRSDISNYPLWQNKRDVRMISRDGGKRYQNVEDLGYPERAAVYTSV